MNSKIQNGLYLIAIPVIFFVISKYVGVDASKPYSEYPQTEGKIQSVERLQLENKRFLRSTTDYYELRVRIENDERIYFFRSPHSVDISKYRPRLRKGQLAQIKHQERTDRGMSRIMNLTTDGSTAIPFGEIVSHTRTNDRFIRFISIVAGIIGAIVFWLGIREKRNANQAGEAIGTRRAAPPTDSSL